MPLGRLKVVLRSTTASPIATTASGQKRSASATVVVSTARTSTATRTPPMAAVVRDRAAGPCTLTFTASAALPPHPRTLPRECGHDAPMYCRYPIHVDQHDPGSTAIRINARVYAWSLSAATTVAVISSAASPLRTRHLFSRLDLRSYINDIDEPRLRLARLLPRRRRDSRGRWLWRLVRLRFHQTSF